MKLVLLDRDGVVVVNRATNIKEPADLALIQGAAEGIRRLNEAGFIVSICTNQPEVARGAMSRAQLDQVHDALERRLRDEARSSTGSSAARHFGSVRTESQQAGC